MLKGPTSDDKIRHFILAFNNDSWRKQMPKIYEWVERKFNFYLTPDMYMPAVERVRGTPARVEDTIRNFPRKLLTKKKIRRNYI